MKKKNKFLSLVICFHFFLPLALKSMSFFTAIHYVVKLSGHFKDLNEVNALYKQDRHQMGKLFFVSSSAALLTSAFLNRKESLKKILKDTPRTKLFLFAGAYFLETYFSLKKYRLSQKFYGYRNADGKSLLLFSFNFPAAGNKESMISSMAEEAQSNNIKPNLQEESSFSFNSSSLLKASPLILPVLDSSMKRDPNEEVLNRENSFKEVPQQEIPHDELLALKPKLNLLLSEEQVGGEYDELINSNGSGDFPSVFFNSAISSIKNREEIESNPRGSDIFNIKENPEEVLSSARKPNILSAIQTKSEILPHPSKINEFFSNPQYQEKKECYPVQTNSPALNPLQTFQEVYPLAPLAENISSNNNSFNEKDSFYSNSDILKEKPIESPGEFFGPENSFERINRNIPSSDISRELENLDAVKSEKEKELLATMKKAFKAALEKTKKEPIILPLENIERLLSLERVLRKLPQSLKPHL